MLKIGNFFYELRHLLRLALGFQLCSLNDLLKNHLFNENFNQLFTFCISLSSLTT
jgi:hypothetical protein